MKPRTFARICTLAAAATLLVAAGSCSGRDEDGDAERLVGSRWVLVDVGGVPAISAVTATLEFPKAGEFGGNNSCNHFSGNYKATATRFEVTELAQTLIGCEQAIAGQETRYMRALGAAKTFALTDEGLVIHCNGLDEPLRFRPAN